MGKRSAGGDEDVELIQTAEGALDIHRTSRGPPAVRARLGPPLRGRGPRCLGPTPPRPRPRSPAPCPANTRGPHLVLLLACTSGNSTTRSTRKVASALAAQRCCDRHKAACLHTDASLMATSTPCRQVSPLPMTLRSPALCQTCSPRCFACLILSLAVIRNKRGICAREPWKCGPNAAPCRDALRIYLASIIANLSTSSFR